MADPVSKGQIPNCRWLTENSRRPSKLQSSEQANRADRFQVLLEHSERRSCGTCYTAGEDHWRRRSLRETDTSSRRSIDRRMRCLTELRLQLRLLSAAVLLIERFRGDSETSLALSGAHLPAQRIKHSSTIGPLLPQERPFAVQCT